MGQKHENNMMGDISSDTVNKKVTDGSLEAEYNNGSYKTEKGNKNHDFWGFGAKFGPNHPMT